MLEMAVNHLKQLRKRRRDARDKRARTAQRECGFLFYYCNHCNHYVIKKENYLFSSYGCSQFLTRHTFSVQGLGPVHTEEKSFRKGYSECLSEVAKMMMFSPAIDDGTRQKLVS